MIQVHLIELNSSFISVDNSALFLSFSSDEIDLDQYIDSNLELFIELNKFFNFNRKPKDLKLKYLSPLVQFNTLIKSILLTSYFNKLGLNFLLFRLLNILLHLKNQ